jgi:hypothetical protein
VVIAEDERSIANRLANEEKKGEDDAGRTSTKGAKTEEEKLAEKDPTAPVCSPLTYSPKLLNVSGTGSCID